MTGHRARAEHPVRARVHTRGVRRTRCGASPTGEVDLSPWLTGTVAVDGVPQAFADLGNPEAHAKILRRAPGSIRSASDSDCRSAPLASDAGDARGSRFTPMADTFPRQYARTQRLTLGEPRNVTVSPDGRAGRLPPQPSGDDPVNCLWVLDVAAGDERLVADPRAAARVGRRRDDLPPEERARRERMREGAGGITAFATERRRRTSPRSPSAGGCSSPGSCQRRRARARGRGPGVRPAPGSDREAGRLRQRPRAAHRRARRHRAGSSPARTIRTSRGAAPTSSPPRRWTATAATGGAPTGTAIAACRVDNSPVQAVVHRRPGRSRHRAPCAVRYPAAGTANPDVTLHVLALDGGSVEVAWDRDASRTSPTSSWIDRRPAAASPCSRATSARSRCSRPTRSPATPRVLAADDRPVVGRARAGQPGDARRRAPRRSPPIATVVGDRSSTAVEITPPDLQVRAIARRSPTRSRSPATRSTTPRCSTCTAGTARDGRARRATPHGRAARSSAGNPAAIRHVSLDRRRARRPASSGRVAARVVRRASAGRAERHDLTTSASAASPPRCCSPTSTTAARCRCCSTRTAARTRSGSCSRTTPTCPRSGSPIRASPSS